QSERPPRGVDPGARLRLERVRVDPGRTAVLELMAGEPEPVVGLQVVARCRLAVARRAAGHELRRDVGDRRLGRGDGRAREHGAGDYNACAAARSSSKSGTWSFS